MSHIVVECPGCSARLKFKPNAQRTTVTCPKCGQKVAFRSEQPPPVEEALVEVDPEPVGPAPAAPPPIRPPARPGRSADSRAERPRPPKRRKPTSADRPDTGDEDIYDYFGVDDDDEPRRPKRSDRPRTADNLVRRERKHPEGKKSSSLAMTLTMVLVPLALLGGGAWFAYRLVAEPAPEVADNDDPGVPISQLIPDEPAGADVPSVGGNDDDANARSGAAVNPVQPRTTPAQPSAPRVARRQPDAPVAPPGKAGGLRYQWTPGQKHVYSVSIKAGDDRSGQTISGRCTYTVDGQGAAGANDSEGSGTGFIVGADGYVATCAHVVEGANRIDVTIGERTYRGRVIATKSNLDLALVKINTTGLTVSQLGDSDRVQLAESVRAFGFPLSSMLGTSIKSAAGEVSGITMHPKHGKQIQTDAPINPGNSGGPLVNDSGQVVGIASSKIAARFASNVGFAVPVNELKKMMREQALPVPGAGSNQKLNGTALAKKVTPTVCFIKVRGALGGRVYNVRYAASYSQHQRYDPRSMGFRPPTFPSSQNPSGSIKVSDSGEVLDVQGDDSLPFVLGSMAQLCLEEIDTDGSNTWTREAESTVSITKKSGQDDRFGGMFPPGIGPRFGPRFGSPFDPFGRNQKPKEQPVDTIPATESTSYRIAEVNGNRVTVSKTYQFSTTRNAARPYLRVKGRGTFVFDTQLGMPTTMTYTATLTKNDDDGQSEIPLTVSYERKDAETLRKEREAAQARMAEHKKKQAEQKRINEEKRTVANPANVDAAIAKTKGSSFDLRNGLKELAGLAVVPEKRAEVLALAKRHMKNDSSSTAAAAASVAVHWASEDDLEMLNDVALERNSFARDARKAAFAKLFELNATRLFPRLLEELDDHSFRYELKKIIIAAGPKLEQPVLDAYENLRDSSAKRECIEIIGKIGTKASKPFLQELFADRRLRSYAGRAMDEIQKRE